MLGKRGPMNHEDESKDSSEKLDASKRPSVAQAKASKDDASKDRVRKGRGLATLAQRKKTSKVPVWLALVIVVVVALLIEVFVCNFRYWQSRDYEPVVLRDTPVTVRKASYSLGFGSLNMDIKNIQIVTDGPEDDSSIWLSLSVADEGDSESYYLPIMQVHSGNARSQIHTIFTYGLVSSLRISAPGDAWGSVDGDVLLGSNSFPFTIESITVNVPVPFAFSPIRFLLVLIACLFVWFLWPGRVPFRIPALSMHLGPSLARTATLVVTLVLLTMFWLSIPRWVGIATANYNSSAYDETEDAAVQLVGQPDTATNEYGKLAQAFAHGQLNLLQEPPQWLIDMDDPYQYGARSEESSNHTRGYLWDTAYYDGHYYVYFGVLPCLVFYLPYYLLTGNYFPNSVAVLIPTLLFVIGWYVLLRALIRWRFTKTSLGTFLLVFLGVTFASGVMFGLGRPGLYNVPVTCGRCLLVWGLYLWYVGWNKKSPVRLAFGSLLMACIAATRPQLLIMIPLLFVLLWMVARGHAPQFTPRRKIAWCACLVVPVVAVAAGVMWYNYARFGSVTDFGANYNLTYNNMTQRGTSLMRVFDGLYYYLFNPPTIVNTFPFINHSAIYPSFAGKTTYEPLIGGLLWLNPMIIAIVFLFGLRRGGADGRGDRPLFWMVGYLLVAGLILVAFDTNGAGILLRYFQDFGFIFGLGAALVFLYHLGGAGATWLPQEYVQLAEAVNAPAKTQKDASDKAEDGDAVESASETEVEAETETEARTEMGADAPAHLPVSVPYTLLSGGRKHSAWAIALFACVGIGFVMAFLSALFMMNPVEGNVSAGGTYPAFWETMRQTFQFWL